MINIVPCGTRVITPRSCEKIVDMFPDKEFNIIDWNNDSYHALKVARKIKLLGRKPCVEIPNGGTYEINNKFIKAGCRLIFLWEGTKSKNFMGSFYPIMMATTLLNENPELEVEVKYTPNIKTEKDIEEEFKVSIESMVAFRNKFPERVKLSYVVPHPWKVPLVRKFIDYAYGYTKERGFDYINRIACDSMTVLYNTSIAPCRYFPKYGNNSKDTEDLRAKRMIGTLSRGIYRGYKCEYCYSCYKGEHPESLPPPTEKQLIDRREQNKKAAKRKRTTARYVRARNNEKKIESEMKRLLELQAMGVKIYATTAPTSSE